MSDRYDNYPSVEDQALFRRRLRDAGEPWMTMAYAFFPPPPSRTFIILYRLGYDVNGEPLKREIEARALYRGFNVHTLSDERLVGMLTEHLGPPPPPELLPKGCLSGRLP